MENKMEEISSQRKLEALEENGTLIRKDGKTFLQLDCENAKELSMKWGEKLYPFTKTGKKWILELPFSTPVNYVQICVDGQEVLSPDLPIAHGYGRPYNYIELPDEDGLFELRDVPHGTLTLYHAISHNDRKGLDFSCRDQIVHQDIHFSCG